MIFVTLAVAAGAADSGSEFLLLEPSARASGLQGAAAADAGNLDALRYNPAGLVGLGAWSMAVSEMQAFNDWTNAWASLGGTLGPVQVAAEFMDSSLQPFTLYDDQGDATGVAVVGSQNGAVGVAGTPWRWLSLGADVRCFRSQLDTYTSEGAAADLGVQVHPAGLPWTFAAAAQNLGVASAYIAEREPLPALLRLGALDAVDLDRHLRFTPRIDAVIYQDPSRPSELRAGVEAQVYDAILLRGGWSAAGSASQVSLGLGVLWGDFALDYAYQPGSDLGATQWVELRLQRP